MFAFARFEHIFNVNQSHIRTMLVDPIKMMVQEGKQVSLDITAPPPSGHYQELRWYKGSLSRTVAFYHHQVAQRVRYFDEYCSTHASPCFSSDKVNLDVTTGRLTFHNTNVTDEDNYYYKFYGEDAIDTGYKYEIQLFVYSKLDFYRPQRSCDKVMFLHLSVILSTMGGCVPAYIWVNPPRADTL